MGDRLCVGMMSADGLTEWIEREARRRQITHDLMIEYMMMAFLIRDARELIGKWWRGGTFPMVRGLNRPQPLMILRDISNGLALALGVCAVWLML